MSKFELEACRNTQSEQSCGEPATTKMFDDAFSAQKASAGVQVADASTSRPATPRIITIVPGNGPFSGPVISNEVITPAQAAKLLAERFKS